MFICAREFLRVSVLLQRVLSATGLRLTTQVDSFSNMYKLWVQLIKWQQLKIC